MTQFVIVILGSILIGGATDPDVGLGVFLVAVGICMDVAEGLEKKGGER